MHNSSSQSPISVVAKAYVMDCLSPQDLAQAYNLKDERSVFNYARQIYGDTYLVTRNLNLRKLLEDRYGYQYWPYEYTE